MHSVNNTFRLLIHASLPPPAARSPPQVISGGSFPEVITSDLEMHCSSDCKLLVLGIFIFRLPSYYCLFVITPGEALPPATHYCSVPPCHAERITHESSTVSSGSELLMIRYCQASCKRPHRVIHQAVNQQCLVKPNQHPVEKLVMLSS